MILKQAFEHHQKMCATKKLLNNNRCRHQDDVKIKNYQKFPQRRHQKWCLFPFIIIKNNAK